MYPPSRGLFPRVHTSVAESTDDSDVSASDNMDNVTNVDVCVDITAAECA